MFSVDGKEVECKKMVKNNEKIKKESIVNILQLSELGKYFLMKKMKMIKKTDSIIYFLR